MRMTSLRLGCDAGSSASPGRCLVVAQRSASTRRRLIPPVIVVFVLIFGGSEVLISGVCVSSSNIWISTEFVISNGASSGTAERKSCTDVSRRINWEREIPNIKMVGRMRIPRARVSARACRVVFWEVNGRARGCHK